MIVASGVRTSRTLSFAASFEGIFPIGIAAEVRASSTPSGDELLTMLSESGVPLATAITNVLPISEPASPAPIKNCADSGDTRIAFRSPDSITLPRSRSFNTPTTETVSDADR